MAAIITDQIRILNAKNFVAGIANANNSYYSFVGLPNPLDYSSTWNQNPPSPKDNFDQENDYWDSMIAMKRINTTDVRQVVPKRVWSSGSSYDMYRHDYSRSNTAPISGSTNLYSSTFYVINSDFRVYLCLQNGSNPETPNGRPSLDEPTFIDLEPRSAGTSGDGYIWKYLYTIKPADIIKFDSTEFMPVPTNWETDNDVSLVRDNAVDGSIKIITVKNRGVGLGTANVTYSNVPIEGDGSGAECSITIDGDSRVESVAMSSQGSGYTFGTVNFSAAGIPEGTTRPQFDVIITPQGGHGADIYRELGAYNILMYSRIESDNENPDFITGNQFARIGIVQNPQSAGGSLLSLDKASAVSALKLTGIGYSEAIFDVDSEVTQLVGTGKTSVGKVINYDQNTGVLKLWQNRNNHGFDVNGNRETSSDYGFELNEFTGSPESGGNVSIVPTVGLQLSIDQAFNDNKTTINNRTYYLGMNFSSGVAAPEVKQHSGNIIYVDNRPAIMRSSNQNEDIKVILQF
tara:strand:+ start:510 stop:2060 length:1551 start_codon:yes stop_codon:yes gene_type:complete